MAGSEEEALAVDSGGGRQLLKGYSAGSMASGSEADTMDSSTRTFLAVRRSRILGMPMTYYALLMASMVLCAFSYSYASRTMRERSANFGGHGHGVAKKGQGALLKAPLPQSSTRGQDLAYITRLEHLPSVRVHGARRRSPAKGRKSKRFASATAATTAVAADNVDSTWDSTSDSVSPATRQPLVTEATPSTVEATAATRSAPASPPPAVTLPGGDVPQNGTFNSSVNLDEFFYDNGGRRQLTRHSKNCFYPYRKPDTNGRYEEVVEYYYMYDDNDTSASSMQRPTRYAELAIPINI